MLASGAEKKIKWIKNKVYSVEDKKCVSLKGASEQNVTFF